MTLNSKFLERRSLEEVNLIGKANSAQRLSSIESRCSEVNKFDSVMLKTQLSLGEVSERTYSYSKSRTTKKTRNLQRLVFERSASSPAIIRNKKKDGVSTMKDRNKKIKEEKMKTEWKIKDRHVSFNECVHVLTKCAVFEMPLNNSALLTNISPSNGCDVCRMESSENHDILLERRVSFGCEEMLRAAVTDQDLSEVKRICQQYGTYFNKKLSNGLTLLHLASIVGCFRIVQYVLDHGGHVDEKDDQGWTPLHYAALHSNVPCALALLRAGADICSRTNDCRTIIELASVDEMILLLGRMMNCSLSKQKISQNKETYV